MSPLECLACEGTGYRFEEAEDGLMVLVECTEHVLIATPQT